MRKMNAYGTRDVVAGDAMYCVLYVEFPGDQMGANRQNSVVMNSVRPNAFPTKNGWSSLIAGLFVYVLVALFVGHN
jgi:hypothetical protein